MGMWAKNATRVLNVGLNWAGCWLHRYFLPKPRNSPLCCLTLIVICEMNISLMYVIACFKLFCDDFETFTMYKRTYLKLSWSRFSLALNLHLCCYGFVKVKVNLYSTNISAFLNWSVGLYVQKEWNEGNKPADMYWLNTKEICTVNYVEFFLLCSACRLALKATLNRESTLITLNWTSFCSFLCIKSNFRILGTSACTSRAI